MIKILKYGEVTNAEIFDRGNHDIDVSSAVKEILNDIKENGDKALRAYTERFDKVYIENFKVSEEEIEEAYKSVDERYINILKKAAANIAKFHRHQLRSSFIINDTPGIIMGQKIIPLDSAGLYVPGGTAAYPSTVLMDSIPAKIAGCKRLVMVSPPNKEGKINPVILASAKIAGVDEIYKIGGAQAIGALAYGTESIPKVDKIVGPGNAYVAQAKKEVSGFVGIDMVAGPSEILVVADKTCNPVFVAADLLSQAEHDKMASAVLVTDDYPLALAVQKEIEVQLENLPRKQIAQVSINTNGKIIVVDNLDKAIEIANEIAPEHLELCVDNPFDYLDAIRHAGSIFLGKMCPEALGDYLAGPNHTLPTSGSAKYASPLSVDDFIKKSQYSYFTADALKQLYEDIDIFARNEGLQAHGISATIRFKED